MASIQNQRHEYSHNSLSVSGGEARVQYGNIYNGSQETRPNWTDIARWIFGSEPVFSQRAFQISLQRRRLESDTGSWFLKGEPFDRWKSQPASFLWLHGKTGCGKTMLCSSAISEIQPTTSASSESALVYYFFTVTDRRSQTCDNLIRTLVYQLAKHNYEMQALTEEHYKKLGGDIESIDYDQLLSLLQNLLKVPKEVYIVIDALDECVDQDETCELIEKICSWKILSIHILVSGITIQSGNTEATLTKLKPDKIHVIPDAVNQDIEAHVRKLNLWQWDDDQKNKIIGDIKKGSDGSFRWAIGQLTEIKKCDTEEQLEKALESLPGTLAETYERILSRINTGIAIENLRTLLCWLLYARRPLRIKELRETVAINWLEKPYFYPKKRFNKRPSFIDQCGFLIVIDEDSDVDDIFAIDVDYDDTSSRISNTDLTWHDDAVLRFAHSSVYNFFQEMEKLSPHAKQFSIAQPMGDLLLAQSSLAYILYINSTDSCMRAKDDYPLTNYVFQYWYSHAQQVGPDDTQVLATRIQEALNTEWDVYRLVTFLNPSTEYNPWRGPHKLTSDNSDSSDQNTYLCKTCQKIQFHELQTHPGFKHKTYDDLSASSHKCKLCKMINCALIQFGIARYCQLSAEIYLSEDKSKIVGIGIEKEIHRNAGSVNVFLRAERQDPFLLISCYCYLGRLHLFTYPAGKILGRPTHLHFGLPGLLDRCAHLLQACEKNHSKCGHKFAPSFLPKRVIDVDNNSIRLIEADTQDKGEYATISYNRGRGVNYNTTAESIGRFMQGIQLDELEFTFRDVITLIRRLCIRYLWIDVLCIMDGSTERENISRYYMNATLNIVAGHQHPSIGMFIPREPPQFSPVHINKSEDMFVGWLGTDSYCDPHGLNVELYPDSWKYKYRFMQAIPFSRRSLVFQTDKDSLITSQLYMQCQEEIQWENGRIRSGSSNTIADWYKLPEEYSRGYCLPWEIYNFSSKAKQYSHTFQGRYGDYFAGLWSGDLFRGLLWRAEKNGRHSRRSDRTLTWSWVSYPGAIKHVWPSNAIVCAEVLGSSIKTYNDDIRRGINSGYIIIRSSVLKLVGNLRTWTDDIEVNVQVENKPQVRIKIRYFIDSYDIIGAVDLFSLKITRRVALLLVKYGCPNDTMRRVGLMIVAKPDTQKWESMVNQCDVKLV